MSELEAKLVGADVLRMNLAGLPTVIRQNILAVLETEMKRMVETVREDKLSGQVLKERSGRLKGSIHGGVSDDKDGTSSFWIGTNVEYAAFHEYGYDGVEEVTEHLRRMTHMIIGTEVVDGVRKAKRAVDLVSGGKSGVEVLVGAHQRRVKYAARSYLRPTLAEHADEIEAALGEAANDGITMAMRGMT